MFLIPAAYAGHAAGLGASLLWTGTSLFFTAAVRRIGPVAVNTVRILLAIVLLGLTHRLLAGTWLPDAHPRQIAYLAGSGVIGLTLGDQALFTAFVSIGPRLAMLIMTTSPLLSALFGWLVLGERMGPLGLAGMLVTVAGVSWVILERPRAAVEVRRGHRLRGMLLAFVAAACQAGGLLLSKQGIGHGWLPPAEHLAPQAATLLRMLFAGVAVVPLFWVHATRRRQAVEVPDGGPNPAGRSDPRRRLAGVLLAFCGATVGPYLGVWLSLEAVDRAPLGIAQTLCSLTPIFILPLAPRVFREHISLRAVLGALVAVGGVALLFVRTNA